MGLTAYNRLRREAEEMKKKEQKAETKANAVKQQETKKKGKD